LRSYPLLSGESPGYWRSVAPSEIEPNWIMHIVEDDYQQDINFDMTSLRRRRDPVTGKQRILGDDEAICVC
jgi:hypothetical protein